MILKRKNWMMMPLDEGGYQPLAAYGSLAGPEFHFNAYNTYVYVAGIAL